MDSRNSFIAICKDNLDDPNGFIFTVYYVNMSSTDIENLEFETWAYMSDDGDFIQTNTAHRSLGKLSAKDFIKIENDDMGSFDFVINFSFNITYVTGEVEKELFRIDKGLSNGLKETNIPLLNRPGRIFEVNG